MNTPRTAPQSETNNLGKLVHSKLKIQTTSSVNKNKITILHSQRPNLKNLSRSLNLSLGLNMDGST